MGSSGDAMFDYIRNQAMAGAGARIGGARLAAMDSYGNNDPSLAAYGGLNALLSGQGDAARGVNAGALQYQQQQQAQQWQQHLMELQAMLQQRLYKSQQPSMWSQLAGIGGSLGGALLGGPFGAALGGRVFGGGGGGGGGMDMNDWLQNGGMNYGGFR